MKHAGQKSVKDKLPEQRKGPKRAVECWLKVQTHVWEQDAGSSSLPTPTKTPLKSMILVVFFIKKRKSFMVRSKNLRRAKAR